MARAVTTEELALLRSDHQRSILYLAIFKPSVVYSARVNQASFSDPVSEITFDGESGTLEDVLVGMTMLVGSSAGARDKGTVRIRKTPGASTFYIGSTSEVEWANDLYLTVVDDFELRAKLPRVASEVIYADYDVAYSDQHEDFAPVAVMGPHAVLKMAGGSVNYTPDGSESWVLGSTISTYLWAAPGASATSGLDSATPTITYNTAGWYRVALTVTAANGKSSTGYRRIYVYDDDNLPAEDFELIQCVGDVENGGWQFEVDLRDEAEEADVVENALVILFAEDWYEATNESLGYLEGYENIITFGRIDGESIKYDGEKGTVKFKVLGLQEFMKRVSTEAIYYSEADTPAAWDEFSSPTVDKALFDLLHWRSTATAVMDIFLTDDTRRMPEIELHVDPIWNQIEKISQQRILARPCCDRYNRLFVEIPAQLIATASRSSIPVIMGITKDDWGELIDIEKEFPRVGMVELSGIVDDTPEQYIRSRAPGNAIGNFGKSENYDDLVFDNQAHANTLSALYFAWLNNPYPWIGIELRQNNRMIDICPNQYISLTVSAGDTPREIAWTNKNLVIKRITLEYEDGVLLTLLEAEAETDMSTRNRTSGVTIEVPPPMLEGLPNIEIPDFEDYSWPGLTPPPTPGNWNWNPPYVPPEPIGPDTDDPEDPCPEDAPENSFSLSYGQPVTLNGYTKPFVRINFPVVLRSGWHTHSSKYEINGYVEKKNELGIWVKSEDDNFYTVYAKHNGGVVATGVKDSVTDLNKRTGVFTLLEDEEIDQIEIKFTGVSTGITDVAKFNSWLGTTTHFDWGWLSNGLGVWAYHREDLTTRGNTDYIMGFNITGSIPVGTEVRVRQFAACSINTGANGQFAIDYVEGRFGSTTMCQEKIYPSNKASFDCEYEKILTSPNTITPNARFDTPGSPFVYDTGFFQLWCYLEIIPGVRLVVNNIKIMNVCPEGSA